MKVLVADDEKDIRRLVVFTLERAGFEILEAVDGNEAFQMATELKPDVILLDVMMPYLDGYEVCKRLREIPSMKDVPVLFLSAKAQNYEISEGMEVGATDYIIKPFIPRELAAKIKALVEKQKEVKGDSPDQS